MDKKYRIEKVTTTLSDGNTEIEYYIQEKIEKRIFGFKISEKWQRIKENLGRGFYRNKIFEDLNKAEEYIKELKNIVKPINKKSEIL